MTPKPIQRTTPDEMQPVFDAIDAFIAGTDWTSCNASVFFDGSGVTHTMNCADRATPTPNSFTYSERSGASRVTVTPPSASLGPGQTQQFAATAVDATGAAIAGAAFTWALSGVAYGSVDATGLYTAPAAIAATVADTLTASLDGEQSWASVTVQLHP